MSRGDAAVRGDDAPSVMQTRGRIADDLRMLGLREGGIVLVHSSLTSLGSNVPGGAETVVCGLLDALGPDGTLLIPALSFSSVTRAEPLFDLLSTPSCIGSIPEHFRQRPGTIRSVQPTHSVCGVGKEAAAMLRHHALDGTPLGEHSPYRALRDRGGQILMLGCGLKPNTSMHGVEELVEPPYLLTPDVIPYEVVLADASRVRMACRGHNFDGWGQRYDRLGPLLEGDELQKGRVLDAKSHLIEAEAMWRKAEKVLRKDPFYFVEKVKSDA